MVYLAFDSWRSFPAGLFRYIDAMRLARFARKHHVSLIHSSDLWLNGYLTCTARRIDVPSVLHVRTPLSTRCVHKHRCDDADSLIAISRRVRSNLLNAGIAREKITVINDSVDIDLFSPQPSAANILNRQFPQTQGLRIGLVGRIEPFKRQLDFLRAAERILRAHGRSALSISRSIASIRSPVFFEVTNRPVLPSWMCTEFSFVLKPADRTGFAQDMASNMTEPPDKLTSMSSEFSTWGISSRAPVRTTRSPKSFARIKSTTF